MTRSRRVHSSFFPEDESKAEPAAAADAALDVVTGLEDPAISPDALAAAEASRRAYDKGQDDSRVTVRRASFAVLENDSFTLGKWLAQPRVKRELRSTERALSEVENGTGSIEDVNMYYALVAVDFGLIDRFAEAGGQ